MSKSSRNFLGMVRIKLKTIGLLSVATIALSFPTTNNVSAGEVASNCTIKMGYRTNVRAPLIAKAPDNSGLYYDLYNAAAQKIGCKLEVVRGPKKRVIAELKSGEIDFYPGFNFSEKRSKFAFYIENGLPGGDVGISKENLPSVKSLQELKGKTLLAALGAPDFLKGVQGVSQRNVRELTIDTAIAMIKKGRGDFYIYNKSSIEYLLKSKGIKDIKVHQDCCGGLKPLYLGFSRKSANLKEVANSGYNSGAQLSPDNFQTSLDKSSVAYKLSVALAEMKKSGETDKIYNKYYK